MTLTLAKGSGKCLGTDCLSEGSVTQAGKPKAYGKENSRALVPRLACRYAQASIQRMCVALDISVAFKVEHAWPGLTS